MWNWNSINTVVPETVGEAEFCKEFGTKILSGRIVNDTAEFYAVERDSRRFSCPIADGECKLEKSVWVQT